MMRMHGCRDPVAPMLPRGAIKTHLIAQRLSSSTLEKSSAQFTEQRSRGEARRRGRRPTLLLGEAVGVVRRVPLLGILRVADGQLAGRAREAVLVPHPPERLDEGGPDEPPAAAALRRTYAHGRGAVRLDTGFCVQLAASMLHGGCGPPLFSSGGWADHEQCKAECCSRARPSQAKPSHCRNGG